MPSPCSVGRLVAGARVETGNEPAERAATGSAGHTTLLLGALAALALVGLARRALGSRRGGTVGEVSAWTFFLLPPGAFALQELAERLLRAESFPFHAALEPRFLVGLLLQLPFGLVALLTARLLLRVAERLGRALGRERPPGLAKPRALRVPADRADLPRIPALALGYAERGPPRR